MRWWIWGSAAGIVLLALTAGLAAWKFRISAASPAETKNPLQLDEPKVPVQALDFTAVNLNGKTVTLMDYRGAVVVLNFWATWCVPCLEEMPALDRLNKALAGRTFRVLAIDLEEPAAKVQEFAKTHRFSFDLLLDTAGEISSHYGVTRIPITYVLDPRGFIVSRAVGPRVWDRPGSMTFFENLMRSPPPVHLAPPASAQAGPAPEAAAGGLALGGVRK
ncbi:MAG: TlpA disulfide reductase family protein [SAR324 cluster bacterium]